MKSGLVNCLLPSSILAAAQSHGAPTGASEMDVTSAGMTSTSLITFPSSTTVSGRASTPATPSRRCVHLGLLRMVEPAACRTHGGADVKGDDAGL
ncbi:hypothetical protein BDV93DRAFT_527062 [Ceratobasidium sp. AG-I]|nr:hypothetical protein BDV93DRAFT_527062 [Ceratobasidium sp. AG-I]